MGLKTWVSGGRIINGQQKFKNLHVKEDNGDLKLTDKIILKPNLSTKYYFFKVRLDVDEYRVAVFDYDEVNLTFNILGF